MQITKRKSLYQKHSFNKSLVVSNLIRNIYPILVFHFDYVLLPGFAMDILIHIILNINSNLSNFECNLFKILEFKSKENRNL